MISVTDALETIRKTFHVHVKRDVIELPLAQARGFCLAEDLQADRDYPPFNRSAMDGFALRSAELNKGTFDSFKIQASVYAGAEYTKPVAEGAVVKIMTGAPVPADLDAVIPVEKAKVTGERVTFDPDTIPPWKHIARRGEDALAGRVLVEEKRTVDVSVATVAASCGYDRVNVYNKPRIKIITTGSELVEPGEHTAPYQIRDSNRHTLLSLLDPFNIKPETIRAQDKEAEMRAALEESLEECDILILTGGVSMGDRDLVPALLESSGVRKIFHKVRIRPGKPLWFGHRDQAFVFGLPGNPVSVLVGFKVFLEPLIYRYMGRKPPEYPRIILGEEFHKKHKFTEFLRVRLEEGEAFPVKHNGSGDFISTLQTEGFLILGEEGEVFPRGEALPFISLRN